jgi:hypothetical protein
VKTVRRAAAPGFVDEQRSEAPQLLVVRSGRAEHARDRF